jgi:hypothetical protein
MNDGSGRYYLRTHGDGPRNGTASLSRVISTQRIACRMASRKPRVQLRHEVSGRDRRFLTASITDAGDLLIEGQDLGPSTSFVSSDGEYEWWRTIKAEHLPALLQLLDAPPGSDVLQVLASHWTGPASHELEKRIRDSGIPSELSTWSG